MTIGRTHAALRATLTVAAASAGALAQTIYFTEVGYPYSTIQRIEADGSAQQILAVVSQGIRGVVLDAPRRVIYWSDVDFDQIYRAPMNDLGNAELIVSDLSFPIDLAVDPSRETLAWTDSLAGVIELSDLEGGDRRVLHGGGDLSCVCIAIDQAAGTLYFEDRATATRGAVRRINLDGSQLETVIDDVPTAWDMALDPERVYVYWTSTAGGINRVRYDGTGFEEVFVSDFFGYTTTTLTLDLSNAFIYFALEEPYAKVGLYRMGLDGQFPVRIAGQFDSVVRMDLLLTKSPTMTVPSP